MNVPRPATIDSSPAPFSEGTALARGDGFAIESFAQAREFAAYLSKSGLIPDHLRGKEHDVFYTVVAGAELGISPLVAIREIYLVNGKPSCSSLLKLALVMRSGLMEKWEELKSTDQEAAFLTRRKGRTKDRVMKFTIQDAERADLLKNPTWKKYPALMLRRRAMSFLLDEEYPEIVKGMGSTDDMMPPEKDGGWAERVVAPPGATPTDTVDTTTGEVTREPEGFETIRIAISEANSDDDFARVITRITEARLNAKEKDDLRELFKARKSEVAKARAAEAKGEAK